MQLGDQIRYKNYYWGYIRSIDGLYANITITDYEGKMLWKPLRKRVLIKNLRRL